MLQTRLTNPFIRRVLLRGGPCAALLALLMVLLCACSSPLPALGNAFNTVHTVANTATGTLSVLPILQKSLQACRQLKTVHVAFTGQGTVQSNDPQLPALANSVPYTLKGAGDIAIDQQAGKVKESLTLSPGQAPPLVFKDAARFVGGQLYLQSPAHRWFAINGTALVLLQQRALTALQQVQPVLPALLPHVVLADAGTTVIGGTQVRHITLSLDAAAMGALTSTTGQLQLQQLLASVQLTRALTADVFIDPNTGYIVRLHIQGGVQVQVDALLAAAAGQTQATAPAQGGRTVAVTFDTTLTLSRFNHPLPPIHAPQHAVPIDLAQVNAALPAFTG